MTSNASTTPSVASIRTTTGAHKHNSDDVCWEYGFIPDKSNMENFNVSCVEKHLAGGFLE